MSITKFEKRRRIHYRIRNKVKGTVQRPRLAVYRSNKGISCQMIDDVAGHTLLSATHTELDTVKSETKTEQAARVGKLIAEKAQSANISDIVFDRGGNLYHGRVKALAEAARENGLKF